jgi:alpha/beta superfamily hydrolase
LLDFVDEGLEGAPLALVLHGLEGSALRPYAVLSYAALRARGIAAVGLNFRGCGGELNRLPRFYHSGETGDPRWVLERMRDHWPGRPLGVLGFSLGGNVLLKLLGELGTEGPELVRAAAVVSVPFDLSAGADALERGPIVRAYARHFVRSLLTKVEAKGAQIARGVELGAVPRLGARADAGAAQPRRPLLAAGGAAGGGAAREPRLRAADNGTGRPRGIRGRSSLGTPVLGRGRGRAVPRARARRVALRYCTRACGIHRMTPDRPPRTPDPACEQAGRRVPIPNSAATTPGPGPENRA